MIKPIAPCLWFDGKAEEAAAFYCSLFKNSRITHVDRFTDDAPDPDGPVIFLEFEINGQNFWAINGGPMFTFSEAVSFGIECEDQAEIDLYYDTLLADGGEEMACGWVKDKFGLSWQIVPTRLNEMLRGPDRVRGGQAMRKMLQMKKLNIAELEAAYNA